MVKDGFAIRDFRSAAQGFTVCTVAVVLLYLMSGMTAVNMREIHLAVLMTALTSACVFYVASCFTEGPKKYLSLISAVPAFAVYYLVFMLSFNACGRKTLPCLSIMESVLFWAGLGTVAVSVIVLFIGHKLTSRDAVSAVLCAGFIARGVMVLFTPLNFNQHDVSNFSPDQAGFHDSYIMYIYNNFTIPSGDVRDYGQFYHPPLHYFISAMFLRLQTMSPLKFAKDINGLKMLPMLWTSFLVLFAKKILEYFRLKGKALAFALMLIVFCPQMIFLSIQVNNDALALMLFVAAVFTALKWYGKPELTTILFLALAIGCAMMTKLSMGFAAFPVAWLFLAKLIKTVKAKKETRGRKPELSPNELIKQFVAFGLVVFPLGLWFPLKNLIGYGVPVTYVYEIDSSANQDVWMYSLIQRLFVPSKELIKTPFLQEGGTLNDYNIFLGILKTGLFDERKFDSLYLTGVGRLLMAITFILVIAIVISAVAGAILRIKNSGKKLFDNPENISLWILSGVLILSEILFCFKHPVVCTEAFRYIAPVLVPAAFWCGDVIMKAEGKDVSKGIKALSVCLEGLTVLFVLSVILFYGPFAQFTPPWEILIRG